VYWLGKSSTHVSPNTRLACQCVLRSFSILDVECGHIPSVDLSSFIEERFVAEQERAIFAILTEDTDLIIEWHGARESEATRFT
jgi:hypothetical protein